MQLTRPRSVPAQNAIKDEVNKQVEGKCLGREGYVIAVTSVKDEDVDTGVVEYDTGCVAVNVRYAAILLRPFKNEVLDAIVDDVSELGVLVISSTNGVLVLLGRHVGLRPCQPAKAAERGGTPSTSSSKCCQVEQRSCFRHSCVGHPACHDLCDDGSCNRGVGSGHPPYSRHDAAQTVQVP